MVQKTIFITILRQFNFVHAHTSYVIKLSFGIPTSPFSTNSQNKNFNMLYLPHDVGSYWMSLRKAEDTLICRMKLFLALCKELALEEALDLS
jgi:hypothetical protein